MAKKKLKKKTQRIVMAKIDFISLCSKGANTFHTIFKSDDDTQDVELTTICKEMNELGEIHACVYAPEMVDTQGDLASAAVIKSLAHDYLKDGAGIDIKHDEVVLNKEAAFVAESFIIQKGDSRFSDMKNYDGEDVDVTGGWGVVLKINDEGLKEKYRSGEWGGVSMGGMAIKKADSSDDVAGILERAFKVLGVDISKNKSNKKKKTENTMPLTKEDQEKIDKQIAEGIAEGLKKAKEAKAEEIKKAAEAGPELGLGFKEPVFPTTGATPEMVKKHLKNLEIYKLSEKIDSKDGLAIYKFNEKCGKIAKSEDLAKTLLDLGAGDEYETFYKSNQTSGQVPNESADDIAIALKKSNDEADKLAKKE